MKYWVVAAILLGNVILQSTLLPCVQIVGTQPDTLILLVVCFGLLGGSAYGMLTGITGGLLQDILYGGPIGLNALQYMIIGYLVGVMYERIFLDRIILPAFFAFCGSLLRGLMMMPYLYFSRAEIPLNYGFTLVVLPEALYTAILMPLFYYLMSLLFSKGFMKKKWHFRRK
ncbi:MAG: rod shape-determining protein MreD [Caldicoprobacterales bacterium]|jgi:rod shape-determining protein MreD|nr:rod shape-determining protein MreD [Clostridiales bacterium]